MKSTKQRAAELKTRRVKRKAKLGTYLSPHYVMVDASKLAPDGSVYPPEFVVRGHYIDRPFQCRDCTKVEVWTATQQKWWYEVAKGGVWTIANRCRPCRRRERERVAEARQSREEGRHRIAKLKAAEPQA